jgi:spermidine synthase
MQEEGHRFLRINGKTDAGTSDEATQLLLGHLPMLLHPKPESVLVIGYGAGGSLGAVTRHPEARRILCAEIEPAVLKAAGFFDERYGRPRSDPRVRVVVEDGRLLCRSLSERFDVIVSEPSNPWLTGVSNLFTVEFYRLLRARLALGGLAVVWIPMYHGTAADARTALGTVREVFPEATLWVVGGADALLIAPADGPLRLDPGRIDGAIGAHERVRADLNGIGIDGWHALVDRLTMDASALKAFARDAPLNTDDRPILEFGLPRTMRPGHRQVEMLEEVYRYYHRPGPRPPADLVIPFARAEAMGVRCRPDGRDAPIRFAGIVRSFRPIRPRPDAPVGIEAQTVSLLSVKTGDGPLEVRSYRRPSIGRRELLATLAGLGVPDPFVETVSDHEAVGGLAGAFGVISWYCPKKGAQLEALLGPPAPAPGWLERMGLACAHDPN